MYNMAKGTEISSDRVQARVLYSERYETQRDYDESGEKPQISFWMHEKSQLRIYIQMILGEI